MSLPPMMIGSPLELDTGITVDPVTMSTMPTMEIPDLSVNHIVWLLGIFTLIGLYCTFAFIERFDVGPKDEDLEDLLVDAIDIMEKRIAAKNQAPKHKINNHSRSKINKSNRSKRKRRQTARESSQRSTFDKSAYSRRVKTAVASQI